ncbi:MAG TPA: selenium metabolism-associated LysR family transcriptional regulator [Anaerovoracaceae bacterium]|nr:selenium metabolism-associated LysR family transcriptional regulator [Anaerovoracaceae bacterium]
MDFKQIEAFVNVVKYKSFSRAADALYLSQPTVSTHINTLENELGVRLIDRHGKEALPTKQGMILYKYGVSMINIREKAVFSMNSAAHRIDGILEIQASSVPGEYMVPSLMAKFRERFPLVRFYLEQSDSSNVEDNLLAQKGEIGFTGYKAEGGFFSEKLMNDRMVLITPNNEKFQAIKGQIVQLRDIINEAFVWREQGSATRRQFEEKIRSMGYNPKQMNVVARLNSMEAIKQAIGYGLGVSIVSKLSVDNDLDRRFLAFDIQDINLDREFYLVWNKNVPISPTAEAFKNFVLKEYNKKE